jgi:hypothetical protein
MVKKIGYLTSTTVIGITTLLVLKIISSSAPVTDEYCFAASVQRYGVWGAFRAWNEVWSPSFGYLPTLALWGLKVNPLMISQFMSFVGLLTILLLAYAFLTILAVNTSKKSRIHGSLIFFCGFVFTITLIQNSSLQNLASNPFSGPTIINTLFTDFLLKPRDGELLQWVFGISLSWQKVIYGSLLAFAVLLSDLIIRNKVHPVFISLLGFVFLLYGPNSESLIYLLYLISFNIYLLLIKVKHSKVLIIPNAIQIAAFFYLTQTPGSNFRKSKFAKLSFSEYLEKIVSLSYQLLSILCITLIITYLLIIVLRSLSFNFVLETNPKIMWIMFGATLAGNYIVATTAYVSTYHWISLSLVFFTLGLIYWIQRISVSDEKHRVTKTNLPYLISTILIAICFTVLYQSSELTEERARTFDQRKIMNRSYENKLTVPIPVYDLNQRVFVFDLPEGVQGISPMYGWSNNSQIKCYRDTNNNW